VQQNIDISDGHLGIVQEMLVFGQNFFFQNLVDTGQLFDVKTRIAIRSHKGHDQGFDGGM